ncbi:hypothetical protein K1T71_005561 [Dendrolimus kikuchii]|uniref:Uncharacterized protein n=1 Tax=Dendrolimus kikuchii TaxID=765133 RepID=A0ACC1D495_9NEOP|nr:hypothetical protein K1T71_005561 [Dendrolimus kikuchii]
MKLPKSKQQPSTEMSDDGASQDEAEELGSSSTSFKMNNQLTTLVKTEVGSALGRDGSSAGGAQTLTFKYSSNLDANRRTPGSIRRQSSKQRAEGLASGVTVKATLVVKFKCGSCVRTDRGAGVGRRAGRQAHRRAATGGVVAGLRRGGRATCHCAASALFAPWSPTLSGVAVLLSARRPGRRRALHRPAALRLPPWRVVPPSLSPLLPPRYTRPAPKNFPHRAGKIDCAASPELFRQDSRRPCVLTNTAAVETPLPETEPIRSSALQTVAFHSYHARHRTFHC